MKLLLGIFVTVFIFACANVNRESQEHYDNKYSKNNFKKRMYHGFMPLTIEEVEKLPQDYNIIKEARVKRGSVIYKNHCLACHGDKGFGNGPKADPKRPPADLVKIVKAVPNFKIYLMASQWQGDMPGWNKSLSKSQLEDLRHFILSLARK